jgi:hypothetical protein
MRGENHLRKLTLAVVVLASAAVLMVAPAGAITYNYEKDFVHDFVGLVVFYTEPDENGDIFSHRCSGSLISPTVFVTAGHCTEGVDEGRVYFAQSVAPNYDPSAFGGLGGDPTTGYPYFDFGPKDSVTFHRADNYGFHNFAGFPDTKDAGVVILDKPWKTASGTYAKLPRAGQVTDYINTTSKKSEVRFLSSGYGLSDTRPVPVSFRERLMTTSYFVNDQSTNTLVYNLQTTNNPSKDQGGTCSGDSGGPVFFEGTNTIASVTSFGMNGECKGLDFSYRLDRTEVLSWILDSNRPDAG